GREQLVQTRFEPRPVHEPRERVVLGAMREVRLAAPAVRHVPNHELANELPADHVGDFRDFDVKNVSPDAGPGAEANIARARSVLASLLELEEAVDRRSDDVGSIQHAGQCDRRWVRGTNSRVDANEDRVWRELHEASIALVARALFLERTFDVRR